MAAVHLRIIGTVQGVFYRAHTKQVADDLSVKGWVRNMPDGSVEIHAEGSPEALKKLEEWCWEGPPAAEVTSVQSNAIQEQGFRSFEVTRYEPDEGHTEV